MNKSKLDEMIRAANQPVVCNCLADIQKVLRDFGGEISRKKIQFAGKMNAQDPETNRMLEFKIIGDSEDCNLRTLLVDGMNEVKKIADSQNLVREQVKLASEEIDVTLAISDIDKARFNIDQLIEKKMGGKRHGLRVRWKVQEGIFEYDPYQHKLYKEA